MRTDDERRPFDPGEWSACLKVLDALVGDPEAAPDRDQVERLVARLYKKARRRRRKESAEARREQDRATIARTGRVRAAPMPGRPPAGGSDLPRPTALEGLPRGLSRSARVLWRGVLVPPVVVFAPESLSAEEILGLPNAELRRVMLERVGLDRVLQQARTVVLDDDTDAGGPRRLLQITVGSRPRRYLHCHCPSTGREYLLRMPPDVRTCREAGFWVAGFDDPDAYRPLVET